MSQNISNKLTPTIVREQTLEWQRRSIQRLSELVSRKVKEREVEKIKRTIKSLFQGVLIDMINGGNTKIGIAMIIRLIAFKLSCRPIEVKSCLTYPNQVKSFPTDKTLVFDEDQIGIKTRSYFISIKMPSYRVDELIQKGLPHDEMIHFIERYNFLMPELGFFWSIHPEAYQAITRLTNSNTVKVIEGFASPLNYNLENYCSVYRRDKLLGSLGTFQEVIQKEVTPEHKSIRWIINPAYTEYLIDIVHRSIIQRMKEYPEDEFFILLPAWSRLPIIEWLVQQGRCWLLTGGTYRVYDHLTAEDVNVPSSVNMIMAYVRSSNSKLNLEPFLEEVLEITTLAGASSKPKMMTMEDIKMNMSNNTKLCPLPESIKLEDECFLTSTSEDLTLNGTI